MGFYILIYTHTYIYTHTCIKILLVRSHTDHKPCLSEFLAVTAPQRGQIFVSSAAGKVLFWHPSLVHTWRQCLACGAMGQGKQRCRWGCHAGAGMLSQWPHQKARSDTTHSPTLCWNMVQEEVKKVTCLADHIKLASFENLAWKKI